MDRTGLDRAFWAGEIHPVRRDLELAKHDSI